MYIYICRQVHEGMKGQCWQEFVTTSSCTCHGGSGLPRVSSGSRAPGAGRLSQPACPEKNTASSSTCFFASAGRDFCWIARFAQPGQGARVSSHASSRSSRSKTTALCLAKTPSRTSRGVQQSGPRTDRARSFGRRLEGTHLLGGVQGKRKEATAAIWGNALPTVTVNKQIRIETARPKGKLRKGFGRGCYLTTLLGDSAGFSRVPPPAAPGATKAPSPRRPSARSMRARGGEAASLEPQLAKRRGADRSHHSGTTRPWEPSKCFFFFFLVLHPGDTPTIHPI